jgi:membrane fusion protein (multidrug efflux system)
MAPPDARTMVVRVPPKAAADARTMVVPARPPRGTPQHPAPQQHPAPPPAHDPRAMPLPAPAATPARGAVMPQPQPQPQRPSAPAIPQPVAAPQPMPQPAPRMHVPAMPAPQRAPQMPVRPYAQQRPHTHQAQPQPMPPRAPSPPLAAPAMPARSAMPPAMPAMPPAPAPAPAGMNERAWLLPEEPTARPPQLPSVQLGAVAHRPSQTALPPAAGSPSPVERPSQKLARMIVGSEADAAEHQRVLELVRRVALQRDLAGATGVIGVAGSELTAASIVVAVVGPTGSIWSPRAGELRGAAAVVQLDTVAQIARGREPAITPRAVVFPVESTGPDGSIAVLIAHRPPTAPAFESREVGLLAAIAHRIAPILNGFLVDHAHQAAREAADHGGLFRAEAIKKARTADTNGKPIFLSARWIKWAYPTILGLIALLVLIAAIVEVPTYSSGAALVQIEGEEITAPSGGTVASISVVPGQEVAAGDELIRLHSVDQEAELTRIEAEKKSALAVFLTDPADSNGRAVLSSILATEQRALVAVDSRVIRATRAGVVNDIRVRTGELMVPGAHVLSIVDHDAEPTIVALLPGADRPRLRPGMTLQVELAGYTKVREEAEITFVGAEAIGPAAARKYLGETVADALQIGGLVVIVRAKLKSRTFVANDTTYAYHDGMPGLGEVRLESKSFLRTIFDKE